ncbi:hypothetical protein BDC45DRAFT_563168 [Circinella umbellata]|nr:hypothetical protein BDC45DRAFT_563168 [Circinella umbellata]
MKLSSALSLIIGSFFVAVKAQDDGVFGHLRFSTYIDGPFVDPPFDLGYNKDVYKAYHALECNQPASIAIHPSATEACQELAVYVAKAKATGQRISALLYDAFSQTYDNGEPCEVFGEKAVLEIHYGELDDFKIDYSIPEKLVFEYPNGCVMKKVAEHANLGHLITFFDSTSLPLRPEYL